ncbi:hypothetical protein AB4144_35295, partial [Rhizobiaceae sp. 2RAB30]
MATDNGFILAHATVITMDEQRRVILDGAVTVIGNTIAAVGKTDAVVAQYPELPRHDYRHHILSPGLIDTHVHQSQAFFRGVGERNRQPDGFHRWLYGLTLPFE